MENINQGEENESEENVGLLVLEPKSFRPFKTKDEYLYAMKEDLAEWFKCLYEGKTITADNFLDVLETGVLLCQHANKVRQFATEQRAKGEFEVKSNFVRDIQIPEYDVQFRIDVKPGTFLARDNISNFITWTTKMRIPEVLRFETDDLVMRKNERSVVLCLLEVARVGAKFGMLAPTIVQMEEEIDNEIETGKPPPQIKTCDVKSLDEMVRELVGRCTCPVQFPIIKVGDGKYKIGDNQTLVFVRILRKHVMIRVGGGWDTLEHYLDRHDPCRCGFQGHRGGRAPSIRRPSTASLSQSLPSTPKTSRKMYVTTTSNNMNPVTRSRPASPCMRSASPGPSSRKKDITVQNSSLQPGVSASSPGTTNKQLTFSGTKLNTYSKQKSVSNSGLSHSGSVGSFVKQSHAYISRQNSSDSQPRTTQKRSSSPALRPQSPASRRSESLEPVVANRLRSPSPSIQSDTKASRTQSAPATNTDRCVSPIKQITLSELRSSREVKLTQQPSQIQQNQKQSLKRQFSTNEKETTMESDSKTHSLTIDKISTMSLGDFKNLLNSALSVPSGASESLCSSDSPRSQSSVESLRTSSMKTNITNKAAEYRSPYSYKPVCTNTNSGNKSSSIASPNKENNVKSNLGCSSSGYSNALTTHKTIKSNLNSSKQSANLKKTDARPRTSPSGLKNGIISNKLTNSQSLSNSNVRKTYSNTSLHGADYSRPKTPTSMARSRSNISSVNDTANTVQYASLSSSNNSLKSCESVDERHSEVVIESYKQPDEVSLTPSSLTSDNLLQSFESTHSVSVGHIRSNSYTPCDEADGKTACDNLNINTRAASEPRVTVPNDYTNGYSAVEGKPLNVGYAYMFSYQSENNDTNDSIERSELEISEKKQNDGQSVVSAGRPSTPSFIPRPLTPKGSKKLTLPQNNHSNTGLKHEEKISTARPPTPRKSNIIARSPGVRSSDSSKEQSYKAIFQKRSMTPCPESNLSNISSTSVRRSSTPGPYLQKAVTLNATSFATTRTRQHENIKQIHNSKDMALSVYSERNINSQSQDTISSLGRQRSQSMDRRLTRQKSTDETVIMVNRSGGQHTVTLQNDTESRSNVHKNKVLARARTEDSRARSQAKTSGITRQRPQSVEPRQLIPRQKTHNEQGGLAAKRGDNGQHSVYDRTQEWVQTAVEQTKAKKTNVSTKVRRSMTPNSFDMKIDSGVEEPRSLEEIKMALSLPINGLNCINPEQLEAPPEDPEMYATMEKLFHELRQQELKASVNETPGSNMNGSKSSKSKSDSSINDEELSLDSNKNVKRKQVSDSTNCSSNVTSPTLSRPNIISAVSSQTNCTRSKPSSRTSSTSSAGVASNSRSTPAKVNYPASSRATQNIPVSMPSSRVVSSSTLSSPQAQTYTERPQSPGTAPVSIQRPQSPRTTPVSIQRPPSACVTSSSTRRPSSPRASSPKTSLDTKQYSRPASPVNKQPPRPSSTPPRSFSLISNPRSKSYDDSDYESVQKNTGSLISKLKEIIKVKPRKDKGGIAKPKSKIPAPKSLASTGKSRSFTNLSELSNTMSLAHTEINNYTLTEPELNGYEEINCGLNVTMSGRSGSETPAPKLNKPLTTGRSSLIRKESMDKNKSATVHKIARAMSVEQNMNSLQYFDNYDEGEFV